MRIHSLLLALALMASPAPAVDAPPERFSEEVTVREVVRIVALPDSLSEERLRSLDAASFQVLEDGKARPVLSVSPQTIWNQILYIDRGALPPESVFRAALALGGQSETLIRRGPLSIVVADPEPREILPATREARVVRQALADLAGEARLARDRAHGARPAGDALAPAAERLQTWVAGHGGDGPVALFWVFPAEPPRIAADPATGIALEAAARALAARGWTTFPLALAAPVPYRDSLVPSQLGLFRQNVQGEPPTYTFPIYRLVLGAHRPQKPLLTSPAALDPWLLPDFAPLKELGQTTAGLVITDERQIAGALDRLGQRYQIVYSSEAAAGRTPDLEITLIPEGKAVRVAGQPSAETRREIEP